MYTKASVKRASGNPGLALQTRDEVVLIDVNDIGYMPSPDDKGVVIVDNIVMKPGRYGITLYLTSGTASLTSNLEGDPDQRGATPQFVCKHPGNEQEVREFKRNNLNTKFIAILRYCSGKPADLIGTVCNPVSMSVAMTSDNEATANEFTFAQISKGEDVFIYKGTIPLEEPQSVVAAGSSTVDVVSDGQYQLTGGSAVIEEITGGAHDSVITLLGTTGEAPTIASVAGKIMLRGGKAFTASDGAQITLRAFDAGDSGLIWIEQSRYIA